MIRARKRLLAITFKTRISVLGIMFSRTVSIEVVSVSERLPVRAARVSADQGSLMDILDVSLQRRKGTENSLLRETVGPLTMLRPMPLLDAPLALF